MESEMDVSWLIQRSKFEDQPERKGIDSIIAMDYMGSSEFEWGEHKLSLDRIRENIGKYVYIDFHIKSDKIVTIFCREKHGGEIIDRIFQISKSEYHLKEHCDLHNWVERNNEDRNDHWWDINNDFMFWKQDDKFMKKFKDKIHPESQPKKKDFYGKLVNSLSKFIPRNFLRI